MIVDKADPYWGENCEGMLYHKIQDQKWLSLPIKSWDYIKEYNAVRIIKPPTYAATFNMIACAAQAARLWKGIDDSFAQECLKNAQNSWKAISGASTTLNGWAAMTSSTPS